MSNIGHTNREANPLIQFLLLLIYAIIGAFACTLLSFAIIIPVYGSGILTEMMSVHITEQNLGALKIMQIATSLGLFLAPPIILALREKVAVQHFYGFKRPKRPLLWLVALIMIFSMPFMEWVVTLNQQMTLPDFLAPLENWMRAKEAEAMQMTYLFLKVNSYWDLILNVFMIALIPGVAEELMFRGAIQRTFIRIFSNPHVAIWSAAFLFSAIHLQFYGFLPRLLLGAGFGYLYFWSGSLWYAMVAHFLNNAYAVGVAWYLQLQNIPLEKGSEPMNIPWYGYLISFVLTASMLIIFKNKSKENNEQLG